MQTLVPVPMSSKLALSMLQQCTAESEEKSVVESMLEVVESLLALLRSLLAVGERLVAPSFGRSRKFARCGGHRSPESILSCTSTRSMDETTHRKPQTTHVLCRDPWRCGMCINIRLHLEFRPVIPFGHISSNNSSSKTHSLEPVLDGVSLIEWCAILR